MLGSLDVLKVLLCSLPASSSEAEMEEAYRKVHPSAGKWVVPDYLFTCTSVAMALAQHKAGLGSGVNMTYGLSPSGVGLWTGGSFQDYRTRHGIDFPPNRE